MHTPGGNPADLRVSDAEREHVVELLNRATGHGLLDLTEFSERTDIALAARTRGELNAVLLDLPGLTHAEEPRREPVPGELLELVEHGAPIRRSGAWPVPKTVVVRSRSRTASLDFTDARIDHAEVRIELHCRATHVRLRLPEGATADTTALRRKEKPAAVRDRGGFCGAGGTPHFVVTGSAAHGAVVLLPPR
ncbi:DUF1707 domain-containing protein [Amycolatopsis minnesotensis]|uniref:DUF1707 domain-containing protein n=1 Tax=Amycolatopsis minnesotensis TaxID=337894 RepID=A0ABP5BUU5_9PSEU